MQLRLRFSHPGLLLALLACCFPGHSMDQPSNPAPAPSNGTNHTSAIPLIKPTSNITTPPQNVTVPAVKTTVPSNSTTASTTIPTTTTSTTNSTTGKTNSTKPPPASSKLPGVTTATPKAPSSSSSTAVTATPRAVANLARPSGFSVASFIGGIVLTLGLLIIGYVGCRTYHSKRGVQYRTIDEHDAII